MKVAEDINYSLESYLKLEEAGELKHEFYYGKLFEMPGAPVLHNNMCLKLFLSLYSRLREYGLQVNVENVKVKIEGEDIYLYPDVLVTKEFFQTMKDYIVHQPVLIAEVLSDSTRKYDSIDKFIQYQKISSLRYYLLVEPEKHVVIFYEKDENCEWSAKTFTEMDEEILLPFFPAQLTLADIYL
ncbi:MAG: Uma2 family endonuclease [Bacteroidota bacterium]|nr:Uma2 family endonuclease [Bacteroidota bacterium]